MGALNAILFILNFGLSMFVAKYISGKSTPGAIINMAGSIILQVHIMIDVWCMSKQIEIERIIEEKQ